jgi:hypothetical protein
VVGPCTGHIQALLGRVTKLKEYLRTSTPKNDFDRILRLQLAHYLPQLVPAKDRDAALALLSTKQHADGGWSIRDIYSIKDWHFERSSTLTDLIHGLPPG